MSRPPCSHRTARGRPCRAPALPGSDPPACAAHAGRPAGPGPLKTGLYRAGLSDLELADLVPLADNPTLDDEIACARVTLRRVLAALNDPHAMTREALVRAAGVAFHGARTIACLLRDQRALSGAAAEGFNSALGQILDELGTLLGIDL